MQNEEKTVLCPFCSDCSFPGPGCKGDGFLSCHDAEKRKAALAEPCPLMHGCTSNKCNVPQLRIFLADLSQCNSGECPVVGKAGHMLKATDFRDIPEPHRLYRRSQSEISLLRVVISH